MPWDPTKVLPAGGRWLWPALTVFVCVLQGPSFLRDLRPPKDRGLDFFQDWASARNRLEGLPVYTPHAVTAERYLGLRVDTDDPFFVPVNAHPPTSVLLALPLAPLPYPDAFLAWNLLSLAVFLVSLGLLGRELAVPFSPWAVFPAVALLLICFPFRLHFQMGQLALVLLGLITAGWVAYRRGYPMGAGALLAAATAVKLFPGFLFLFFVARRQGRVVIAGILAFLVLTALTVAVLGPEVYLTYVKEGLPEGGGFRSGWWNVSLPGLWFKLFDPLTERTRVEPLWRSPLLARAGALLCCAGLAAVLARWTYRARSRDDEDRAFALAVIAMLLVSPLTWEHYLPLLVIPLAIVWVRLPPQGASGVHWLFVALLLALWLSTERLTDYFLPGLYLKNVAAPLHTLALLSLKLYALLGLFAFTAWVGRQGPPSVLRSPSPGSPEEAGSTRAAP